MANIPVDQNAVNNYLLSQLADFQSSNPAQIGSGIGYLPNRAPPAVLASFSCNSTLAVAGITSSSYKKIPFVESCATGFVPIIVGSYSYFTGDYVGVLKVFYTGVFSVSGFITLSGVTAGDEVSIKVMADGAEINIGFTGLGSELSVKAPASGDFTFPVALCFYQGNGTGFNSQPEQPKVPTNWDFSLGIKSPALTSVTIKQAAIFLKQEM